MQETLRRNTRIVRVGNITIGGDSPISVQSMAATHTWDVDQTVNQINMLDAYGAGIVRVAVDSMKDIKALPEIRDKTTANLCADFQENYPLLRLAAPYIDKARFNPGHLHHLEKYKSQRDKIAWIVDVASQNGLALRDGVNCGSVEPELEEKFGKDRVGAVVESAIRSTGYMDDLGFKNYVVSIKDSDPIMVIEANRRFAEARPDVPLHIGLTEAGTPSMGIYKTRMVVDTLLREGIVDTLRVSLTLKFPEKYKEVLAGQKMIDEVLSGQSEAFEVVSPEGLNLISCPSCSRVENEDFVELAEEIERRREGINKIIPPGMRIDVAVMGCRVNGPGETDHADLGIWCGPQVVRLKRKEEEIGIYSYQDVMPNLLTAIDQVVSDRKIALSEPPVTL